VAEGDTILRAARRLDQALAGETVAVSAPNPRGRAAGVERLDGHRFDRAEARGKHLLLHFDDLVLHSHLGMSGGWHVYPRGARWRRPRSAAWAVLGGERAEAVQFGGPTLRLLAAAKAQRDPQLARLGPDILDPEFDPGPVVAAMRADPGRGLGDALLDQTLVAGIGNIFKSEACFAARSIPGAGSVTSAKTSSAPSSSPPASRCSMPSPKAVASASPSTASVAPVQPAEDRSPPAGRVTPTGLPTGARAARVSHLRRHPSYYVVAGVALDDEMDRLRALSVFADGPLAESAPELKVRRASRKPNRLGFAVPTQYRLSVTAYPGVRPGDVLETLLHELTHLHVGRAAEAHAWHGPTFKATLARAMAEAYGVTDVRPSHTRHGTYAEAIERRRECPEPTSGFEKERLGL
jgi:endonuclease-8